jgi:xanthine dehydrogenase YagS FAD-binding subunit
MDRQRWSFPIVGVAAVRNEGMLRFGLAGVAPIPWLLEGIEGLEASTPLPGTAYKVPIARALMQRAHGILAGR